MILLLSIYLPQMKTVIWKAPQLHSSIPGGPSGKKKSSCQCSRCKRQGFDPWVRKSPWRRAGQSTPVFLPGESCGQRSLVAVKNGIQQTSMHGSKLNVHQQTNGKELIHTRKRVHAHSYTHTHTYHTMEYYTAIEMNENLSSATTWTDLEVMLSKRSQTEKA